MENKIDALKVFEDLNNDFDLNGFYVISISPSLPEIKLQGYFTRGNVAIARKVDVELILDENGFLRGSNGIINIVLTD